jgi:hypothetical protein
MLNLTRRALFAAPLAAAASTVVSRRAGARLRISLNAYSFNRALLDGGMSISDLINCCAQHNFDGLDLTGYYFPGYPQAPSGERIYEVKRAAFQNAASMIGAGVRNDFALTDPSSPRKSHSAQRSY